MERQHAHDEEGRLILTGAVVEDLRHQIASWAPDAADGFRERVEFVLHPAEHDPVHWKARHRVSDEFRAHLSRRLTETVLGVAIAWLADRGQVVVGEDGGPARQRRQALSGVAEGGAA